MKKRQNKLHNISKNEPSNHSEVYVQDPRIRDMAPIIASMEFLLEESEKRNNHKLYDLIASSFNVVLVAYDLIIEKYEENTIRKG